MLKQTSTVYPRQFYWHFSRPEGLSNALALALECDTNYSPPVTLSLLMTLIALSATYCQQQALRE